MNLITDRWLPIVRENGQTELIAPWQIAEADNQVIDIKAPRLDFQGALYQFLIGLLQTCFAPEDEEQWMKYWQKSPKMEALQTCFDKVASGFELSQAGPAFMQDFELPDGEYKPISGLLIDAPGSKTLRDNQDHFIKRDFANQLCQSCAATALFALQINAPAGGVGHRVGLRGGGPLTTLVVPTSTSASLWQKLWLNVLNQTQIQAAEHINADVLPWLGKTRISDNGQITRPVDAHPLQAYWSMPRRIRLRLSNTGGDCQLCGQYAVNLVREYRSKNYGTHYHGAWLHPLTPYRYDAKKANPPLSLKGQQGGWGYRHWLGLALRDGFNGNQAAQVVQHYSQVRGRRLNDGAGLWCFGYDMDNMKARCWYEAWFPVFYLAAQQRQNLMAGAGALIDAARETAKILKTEVKAAWFHRPEDTDGNMSAIDVQFWQASEAGFYRLLAQLAVLPGDCGVACGEIYAGWLKALHANMLQVFETATLTAAPEGQDLKRIVHARQALLNRFYNNKAILALKTRAKLAETA